MTIDEPEISRYIREFLHHNPHSGATLLHDEVMGMGKGHFGQTAVWKTIKTMVESGELEVDTQENKRTFYSLGDVARDVSKILDVMVMDLEEIQERLDEFHNNYTKPKSQTELNYSFRLMDLVNIARSLLGSQSYLFLVANIPDFTTHKSWKNINKTIDHLWNYIRANAGHQSGNNSRFLQEMIWSLRAPRIIKAQSVSSK